MDLQSLPGSELGVVIASPSVTPGNLRLTAARARCEALALSRMVGKNGETIDSIRELIEVDSDSLKSLHGFVAKHPIESHWVMEALLFREAVLERFEQLAVRG